MSQNPTQQVNVDLQNSEDVAEASTTATETNTSTTTARTTVAVPTTRSGGSGLGERLNHVFREIRPLVEQARMGNNSRLSLPTWLPRAHPQRSAAYTSENAINNQSARSQSTVAHVDLGLGSQTYVLNDGISPPTVQRQFSDSAVPPTTHTDGASEREAPSENPGEHNASVNPANNNFIPESPESDLQSEDGNQQVLDIRSFLNVLVKYSPFYLILLVKFMYDRREGLFTFFILLCTFHHGNTLVRKENGKQASRSVLGLLLELIYTSGCVLIVYIMFGHGKLLENIVMYPGYGEGLDVWNLIWLVCLTDLIVKIITVDVKIVVTLMPAVMLPFQKRGKLYLFIEAVSQLYRCLLPIQPWLAYLMNSYAGSEKMIGMFLSTAYVVAKIIEMLVRLKLFKNATWTLLQSVNLGTKPTIEQLLSAGESCPICHDDYSTPVRLGCSHIFCELCISAWLDREHTCPLCRAKVTDEPTWRDGSTTNYFQLY